MPLSSESGIFIYIINIRSLIWAADIIFYAVFSQNQVYYELSKTRKLGKGHRLPARDFAVEEGWRVKLYQVYYELSKTHLYGKRSTGVIGGIDPARIYAVRAGLHHRWSPNHHR